MKKSFGGLINKLTSSGKLEAGVLKEDTDDEEHDVHYRKPSALDNSHDVNQSEDFKVKKSFSLRGLSPFKPQETASSDADYDFSKRKSSSMRSMPDSQKLDKEKLHESDEKVKKSFSLRGVPSVFGKSPESKTPEPLRSPSSLKTLFSTTQYEQHYDFNVAEESDEEEVSEGEEGQAVVPTKKGRRPRVNSTYDDFEAAHHKPLASSAPAFSHYGPTSPVALAPHPASSPPKTPSSPPKVPSSPPSGQVPASFASSPPRAQVNNPPRLQDRPMATSSEDFEAQFGRMRSDSTTSDDDTLITSSGGGSSSLFPFSSSKARKLK